ncbi:putative GTPase ArgK [Poriferisphaera corsica]|uniref:Putative GTPase ArgK n=1 Tax=Poriferisphaera corsica TaxID=2528020 RepID=A0A517YYU0_9BACT|nr:GTP-binding protein [Poriferisphaera corsica]QDU35391.1 putative GTPase ArgK [Poriferisphaera corsica]
MTNDLNQLVEKALEDGPVGIRAAGRLMSLMEDQPWRLPELFHAWAAIRQGREDELSEQIPMPRLFLGITGAPGSGKSTMTDALVGEYREKYPDKKVGVIAVDPSSPFTGGSVLGDRVRMMRHATDSKVFIRSLSARGHLGGLTLGVKGVARIMGLIGCDVVIIETVGVGQSEVEVTQVADLVAVVLAPGQGDSIQMLKAGLMEIADLFVINKMDREGSAQLHTQLLSSLNLSFDKKAVTDVQLVSATDKVNIDVLVELLDKRTSEQCEAWPELREKRMHADVSESVLDQARMRLAGVLRSKPEMTAKIIDGTVTVKDVAHVLLKEACSPSEDCSLKK